MMLEKYGVLKITSSSDVKRKLDNFYLIENMDYIVSNLTINTSSGKKPLKALLNKYFSCPY